METPRYDIVATDSDGKTIKCFTWTRDAESGVRRAKKDAKEFGREDLTDFRAVPHIPALEERPPTIKPYKPLSRPEDLPVLSVEPVLTPAMLAMDTDIWIKRGGSKVLLGELTHEQLANICYGLARSHQKVLYEVVLAYAVYRRGVSLELLKRTPVLSINKEGKLDHAWDLIKDPEIWWPGSDEIE